ncbi:MAG: hypothetical protein ACOC3C_05460 [Candidatus Thorarchaeota archaeon]
MKYEGRQTMDIPGTVSKEEVEECIDDWLRTGGGYDYGVKEWSSERIVLEKEWKENRCFKYWVFGLGGLYMDERIRMTIRVEGTRIYLKAESTKKKKANEVFDSLITKIEETFLESTSSG